MILDAGLTRHDVGRVVVHVGLAALDQLRDQFGPSDPLEYRSVGQRCQPLDRHTIGQTDRSFEDVLETRVLGRVDDEVEDAANLANKIRFSALRPRSTSVPHLLARTVLVYRRR